MPNFSVHCIECNSENLAMLNAAVKWETQTQRWVYDYHYRQNPIYFCSNCFCESRELVEKEV